MMMKRKVSGKLHFTLIAAAVTIAGVATHALGQATVQQDARAHATRVSLDELAARLSSEGLELEELEIQGRLLKVEARDANGREVDLVIDRDTGETLSRKVDAD